MAVDAEKRRRLNAELRGARAEAEGKVSEVLAPVPVLITLGEREFRVGRVTFNHLVAAERAGLELNAVLEGLQELRPSSIRALTWLMVQAEAPDVTLEAIGELMPVDETAVVALLSALLEASGLEKKGAQEERPEAGGRTGGGSSGNSGRRGSRKIKSAA